MNNNPNTGLMSLRRFIFPCYDDDNGAYSLLLLVVRIFFGIMFLTHGYDKLMAHATMADLFANPIGLGSAISFWMVVFAELVCSLALIFGILQRVALIPMIISMAVAFFMVHGGAPFAVKELSFVYLMVFVLLFITGPGRYSFDAVIGNYVLQEKSDREMRET